MARRARGWGHELERMALKIEIDIPIGLRLKIDGDELQRKVGSKVAGATRKRLRAGLDGDGTPLDAPKSGGRPLRKTGRLIESIRYHKDGTVAPGWRRREDISDRARSNYGLMGVHISGVYHGHGERPFEAVQYHDPMGAETLRKQITQWVEAEIARQLAKGSAGLVGELRRIR